MVLFYLCGDFFPAVAEWVDSLSVPIIEYKIVSVQGGVTLLYGLHGKLYSNLILSEEIEISDENLRFKDWNGVVIKSFSWSEIQEFLMWSYEWEFLCEIAVWEECRHRCIDGGTFFSYHAVLGKFSQWIIHSVLESANLHDADFFNLLHTKDPLKANKVWLHSNLCSIAYFLSWWL